MGWTLIIDPGSQIRFEGNISSKARHSAKGEDLSGDLFIQSYGLRSEYHKDFGQLQAFIGFGINQITWRGSITEVSSSRKNVNESHDTGLNFIIGCGMPISGSLIFAPEVAVVNVSGEFNNSFSQVALALRWRF